MSIRSIGWGSFFLGVILTVVVQQVLKRKSIAGG